MDEKRALLYKENEISQRTNPRSEEGIHETSSEGSDEWWEGSQSSCSSCCDSHSGSSFEWEAEIKSNGELIFIESYPIGTTEKVGDYEYQKSSETEGEEKTAKVENAKKGRFANWIRRRDNRKSQLKSKSVSVLNEESHPRLQENALSETSDENKEFKDFTVKIDNVYTGQTLSERLLGLKLGTLNNNKVTIISIHSDGPTRNCMDLAVGDILYGINNLKVTPHNLEGIFDSLNFPTEVLLRIEKVNSDEEPQNSKYQSNFVKSLLEINDSLEEILLEQPVGIVVVDMESQNLNKDDVIYSYPKKCVLSSCRGAFVTLFHLLGEISPNDECQSSRIIMKKQPTHVFYKSENNFLLLIAIPVKKCTLTEATFIVNDLIRNLLFTHQTLKRCFETSEKSVLDHLFSIFFTRILTNGFSSNASQFMNSENLSSVEMYSAQFEDVLPHVIWVPLPREAQIQIDDALNELEANDIEHEDEDIINSQRLFNIIGSCLFHKGYLLLSHLPKEDLLDVYTFCRQNCLIQLLRNEPVKSLVIWKEVFPQSVHRGLPTSKPGSYPLPNGKWFLSIVGQVHDALAVILEAGSNCVKLDQNPGPSIAYLDEAMDTLRHIQKLGISSLASQWIDNNSRFKTTTPEEMFARKANRKKENLLGFVKSFEGNSKSPGINFL